ncbi:MAG: dienelactone hydrolase family protein [Alphaproteobacteria bacterium]|nr:dienelactone hydrolase family protein [Alphaproteobacteria bacterium]
MGDIIQLKASDGHELAAYVAEPEGAARGGIVVIQEIFGVNSHIRAVADGFAADGYKVIAPAMFDRIERNVDLGYDPDSIARGRELKGRMDWDNPLLDIQAAIGALSGLKVGVTGYCWGGSLAWLAATRLDGVSAAICYYGGQINDFRNESAKCPALMHFGSEDGSIPMEAVEAIRAAQPDIPIHLYEGAGHGFSCDHRGSYDAGSAATARQRTMEFLAKNVG